MSGSQYWSLSGTVENWGAGIERRLWGLRPKLVGRWERLSSGDTLFFYAHAPVGGVIGYGKLVAKFSGDTLLWPDEVKEGKVLYPYRFEFEISKVLTPERWATDRILVRGLGVVIRSMGRIPREVADKVFDLIKEKWREETPPPPPRSRHELAKELLIEIGHLKGMLAAEEYPVDGERLDVVWRKVEKGVPRYSFEVQIGGDIYHTLGKLKHAFDLWGSRLYLVVDGASVPKAMELFTGAFHEIAGDLRIVQLENLEELQRALGEVHSLERELGFD